MSPPREVDEVFLLVVELLDREGVPYVAAGGIAVNAWGVPRTTFDFDIAISLPRDALAGLLAAAEREGFLSEAPSTGGFLDVVAGMPLFTIRRWIHDHGVAIDLFLTETPFLREVLARRVSTSLDGRRVFVASAADVVLLKLFAWRPKDRLDIQNVLTIQGVPEEEHLRHWAAKLGVLDRLETILSEHRASEGP